MNNAPPAQDIDKKEYRCKATTIIHGRPSTCNALLFKGEIQIGRIEKKCTRCGTIHTIEGVAKPELVYIVR